MSQRPLENIRRYERAADRYHRSRRRASATDTIDALDTIGGGYHHAGPYDATLRSHNIHPKYSPVAAVRESNLEAIRATPRENIMDALQRHMPLQGTATIPPGEMDMSGHMMQYQEGADLMREPDAQGGPYRRWANISYHPDDLKGKGEPSFTIERQLARRHHRHRRSEPNIAYEMQPGVNAGCKPVAPTFVRQRSFSTAGQASSVAHDARIDPVLPSNSTTAKGLGHELRRRFGSLRKIHPGKAS